MYACILIDIYTVLKYFRKLLYLKIEFLRTAIV